VAPDVADAGFGALKTATGSSSYGPSSAARKHGFESRWGHQIDFVSVLSLWFEKHSIVSRTHLAIALRLVEDLRRFLLVERDRAFQLRRPDRRVDLRPTP
jgi:hypothetical protein